MDFLPFRQDESDISKVLQGRDTLTFWKGISGKRQGEQAGCFIFPVPHFDGLIGLVLNWPIFEDLDANRDDTKILKVSRVVVKNPR